MCPQRNRLSEEVQDSLSRLAELAVQQRDALEVGAENLIDSIDKQIEHILGQKERSLGALRQHRQDHGC